jgi:hypothetical protein
LVSSSCKEKSTGIGLLMLVEAMANFRYKLNFSCVNYTIILLSVSLGSAQTSRWVSGHRVVGGRIVY